jgi:hypothetical protein
MENFKEKIKNLNSPQLLNDLISHEQNSLHEKHVTLSKKDHSTANTTAKHDSELEKRILKHYEDRYSDLHKEIIKSLDTNLSTDKDEISYNIRHIYNLLLKYRFVQHKKHEDTAVNKENYSKSDKGLKRLTGEIRQQILIEPTMLYIEKNYMEFLLDEHIFPIPVSDLLNSILEGNILEKVVKMDSDNIPMEVQHFYNGFSDKVNYKAYLEQIYSGFYEYIIHLKFLIKSTNERFRFYNILATKLFDSMKIFNKPNGSKSNYDTQPFIRPDAIEKYNERCREVYKDTSYTQRSTLTYGFMNEQHSIAKEAYRFIKSQIMILNGNKSIINNDNGSNNVKALTERIETDMSIAEIGLLIRLLIYTGYIKKNNLSLILRSIADNVTTIKTDEPKVTTMRKRYYNPSDGVFRSTTKILQSLIDSVEVVRGEVV